MDSAIVESKYPLGFRSSDVKTLGEHLRHRHSIDLIGMRRVGISNFLRFFLNKKGGFEQSIGDGRNHVFIFVDLNDLVERELFPFWTLTLKRIVDTTQKLSLPKKRKKRIENLFLMSIQSQDLFLVIDSIREALLILYEEGFCPTIFFLRFDRLKDVVNANVIDNLQGLRDATNQQLCYVFTSYRSLEELLTPVVSKAILKTFSHPMYLKPASLSDIQTIYQNYEKRYRLTLHPETKTNLLSLVGGNVQYLQVAVVILHEKKVTSHMTQEELVTLFCRDERISLYTEELWESLSEEEKTSVYQIHAGKSLSETQRQAGAYLWLSGMVRAIKGKDVLFSDIFAAGIGVHSDKKDDTEVEIHFSKKEQQLIDLLLAYKDQICERDIIVEKVWPEYVTFGVSDWAIDRLVARVRNKLRQQKSTFEIKTIRTRGYKLSEIR